MKHTPKIGAFVLETLTTGMYTNPFDCIREYVQNAADAILSAERFEVMDRNKGIITITADPSANALSIKDNGTGIPVADAVAKLLNVGMSSKLYGQEAGFRGIGRLAGIAYCDRLHFTTTSPYEDAVSKVTFDCRGIRASISPALREAQELADVLQKHTSQDLYEAKKTDHYTEVRLEGLNPTVSFFLDLQQLESYLSQVAPVEYDSQRFLFAPQIEKWLKDHGIFLPWVKLLLRSPGAERQVFKPYKQRYRTRKDDYDIQVRDVAFFPEDAGPNSAYWMWYPKHEYLGMLGDERVAGLRFRRNNIAIGGPDRVAELFPGNEGRLNSWTLGEIHVLSQDVIPNARRDGFESTPAWTELKSFLQPFIKNHCKACHDASAASNRPTVKILASAEATVETAKKALRLGMSSKDERKDLLGRLQKEAERVSVALEKRDTPSERQELQSALTSIKAVAASLDAQKDNFTVKKIKSNLDRKQKRILMDVLDVINNALSGVECSKSRNCLEVVKTAILAKYTVREGKDE